MILKMYSTSEAADVLKISVRTLKRWLKNGILKPVTTYDNGYNAYSEEQLKNFQKGMTQSEKNVGTRDTFFKPVTKDVTPFAKGMTKPVTKDETCDIETYDKKNNVTPSEPMTFAENVPTLQSGDIDKTGDTVKNVPSLEQMKGKTMQNLKNLPEEIKNSARFFAVGTKDNPKAPKVKNWSDPENQTTLDKIDSTAGFDTCGHGNGVDYCFLDFDHILTDTGEFVTDSAASTVADLQGAFPNIYIEKSISKHGLHAFFTPTADKFDAFNAGSKGTVYFSDSREKDAPKLEIFYKSRARYCLVTGDLYGTGADVPSGEPADEYLSKLLAIVASQVKTEQEIKSVVNEVTNKDTPPEYHRDLAIELW